MIPAIVKKYRRVPKLRPTGVAPSPILHLSSGALSQTDFIAAPHARRAQSLKESCYPLSH